MVRLLRSLRSPSRDNAIVSRSIQTLTEPLDDRDFERRLRASLQMRYF
jgi:putative intracellular protease/amidase